MGWKINRTWRVVLLVLVLLVAVRLSLPFFMTRYVNRTLSELEGYSCQFHDIDIHLYRGAYQINDLQVFKSGSGDSIPLFLVPVTDLSIQWSALLEGSFAGEISFHEPVLNYVHDQYDSISESAQLSGEQTGKNNSWTQALQKLMPLDINRVAIKDGKIALHNLSTDTTSNLILHHIQMEALNLCNVKENPEDLPSRIYLQALSFGNGQLNIAMRINVLKKVPDLDLDMQFENINMKELSDFFEEYADANVTSGNLNLYAEMAVTEGEISGYVKPALNGLEFNRLERDDQTEPGLYWQTISDFLEDISQNQKHKEFASRVSMNGTIPEEDPLLLSLWETFSDALIEAFETNAQTPQYSGDKSPLADNSAVAAEEKKSKREIRKEKRKEKREQRRKARREKKESEESSKASRSAAKDNSL